MTETAPPTAYYSYMLRFWPEPQPSGETEWRFTLVNSGTGRRRAFASLEALVEFLSQFTQGDSSLNLNADNQA